MDFDIDTLLPPTPVESTSSPNWDACMLFRRTIHEITWCGSVARILSNVMNSGHHSSCSGIADLYSSNKLQVFSNFFKYFTGSSRPKGKYSSALGRSSVGILLINSIPNLGILHSLSNLQWCGLPFPLQVVRTTTHPSLPVGNKFEFLHLHHHSVHQIVLNERDEIRHTFELITFELLRMHRLLNEKYRSTASGIWPTIRKFTTTWGNKHKAN